MPPLLIRRLLGQSRAVPAQLKPPSICLLCSYSAASRRPLTSSSRPLPRSSGGRKHLASLPRLHNRDQSTSSSSAPTGSPPSDPRQELQRALLELESRAPNHINLARLQLALRNLSEPPGHESIRVAVLNVTDRSGATAKRLVRLALADPLKPAEPWEEQLEAHETETRPLVVRIAGPPDARERVMSEGEGAGAGLRTVKEHVIAELRVSSPLLNGANLEMLVADAGSLTGAHREEAADDAVLVPVVDVATTTAGHVAPVATPVHIALLVGDGVLGAASILSLPISEGMDTVAGVVNFVDIAKEDLADCPLVTVNVDAGSKGLELFRGDVGKAMEYEALWSKANVARISEWLRKSALPSNEGGMKTPVRNLIGSLLRNAKAAIQADEARGMGTEVKANVSPGAVADLDQALSDWAQNAHQELQQQLDAAFTTGAWSKLGWWKLFWRADDVGMVTSEMVAQRFLPGAEKGIIYLAGRIQEAGPVMGREGQPVYSTPSTSTSQAPNVAQTQDTLAHNAVDKWPTHIPFTRNYLQEKTVPALQALAQKLAVQSASLAGLSTALAGLSYLSAFGAYECGAIAALGIALSFKRLQQKWDAAREYWQGEVREEGRKAIRATEMSVAQVLDKAGRVTDAQADGTAQLEELTRPEEVIKRAEEALARIK
ncbi:uncharacterized protein B0T15DRAFT_491330 [Chaetomium strumarium]|uniref:Mmc1 C-terminal domain-containing protein n=1 Tax=Chaetomium strumarium TaxID=1170767 RepID=A0AAJ0M4J5_9PEZI|nr:hypothetical protein B0T15DRAFT_491330 [Chaetomium strumarium]